ncbi:hypothetical protein Ccrd_010199 [Cynara cardunculus var. scolymus]|uniref:Proline dehydrogenase n=1 Tax=Cynara cardunculus var. scolymus TaxID=59895 RepID=A0A103YLJ5_CYNCS|nr:hypothetical protein Ccrd_010199 [Cynara cardunculus var. scolymus]
MIVVIEAEDTSIQLGIDYFIYSTTIMYNKCQKPMISGTTQVYMKDASQRLLETKKAADEIG